MDTADVAKLKWLLQNLEEGKDCITLDTVKRAFVDHDVPLLPYDGDLVESKLWDYFMFPGEAFHYKGAIYAKGDIDPQDLLHELAHWLECPEHIRTSDQEEDHDFRCFDREEDNDPEADACDIEAQLAFRYFGEPAGFYVFLDRHGDLTPQICGYYLSGDADAHEIELVESNFDFWKELTRGEYAVAR